MASDDVVACLLALAAGEPERAERLARAAAGDPSSRVGPHLARLLAGERVDVWGGAAAFERFIDGGGNVALYAASLDALAAAHRAEAPASAVDLGCGDGRLSAAAVHPGLRRLDLVDPSAERLAAAAGRLVAPGQAVEVTAHEATAAGFLAGNPDATWDAAQSTFALLAMPPGERREVLRTMARRTRRLLVVEFDVPAFADRSEAHARYAAERYEAGVAEYEGDDLVIDGFLMPVLVAQFEAGARRATWEQPVAASVAELAEAGFGHVEHRRIAPFWWAPAHLIDARGVS